MSTIHNSHGIRLSADAHAPDRQDLGESILRSHGAWLAYGRHVVLRNVDIEIAPAQFWCFLGPNGEGKTTLINALMGAIRPSRGRIDMRFDFQKRDRIALVPQRCELNPSLPTTVEEFVLTAMVGIPSNGSIRANRLERVLELVGLSRVARQSYWTLSTGQRQRAMLARALVRDPRLLVLDEPTAALDLGGGTALLKLIHGLNQDHGVTVVLVTHDLRIAAAWASHVALFRHGDVVAGPVDDVFTSDHLEHTFGVPIEVSRRASGFALEIPQPGREATGND